MKNKTKLSKWELFKEQIIENKIKYLIMFSVFALVTAHTILNNVGFG
jgi:hypothetical protein